MVDKTIFDLAFGESAPVLTDVTFTGQDPSGTPVLRKSTWTTIRNLLTGEPTATNDMIMASGTAWQKKTMAQVAAAMGLDVVGFTVPIGDGVSVITTGIIKRFPIPYNFTLTKIEMCADISGSIVLDIWKDSYANLPCTVADTITASAKPTISSATKAEQTVFTDWDLTWTLGEWIYINVDSCTSIRSVAIAFYGKHTELV